MEEKKNKPETNTAAFAVQSNGYRETTKHTLIERAMTKKKRNDKRRTIIYSHVI